MTLTLSRFWPGTRSAEPARAATWAATTSAASPASLAAACCSEGMWRGKTCEGGRETLKVMGGKRQEELLL